MATSVPGHSNNYKYSFSGADAKTLVWFDAKPELTEPLDSVHTISVSVHESKGQARALGYRGIRGLARGVRTIAGTMILTVINDHPLYPLMKQYNAIYDSQDPLTDPTISTGWSLDRDVVGTGSYFGYEYRRRLGVLLPPFNLLVRYVSEQGNPDAIGLTGVESAGWILNGVEFIDEGQVTSVNDIVTEMTFSFIACDFKPWTFDATQKETVQDTVAALDLANQVRQLNTGLTPEQLRSILDNY